MRWLVVVLAVLVSACTPTSPPTTMYTKQNAGYDVTRDPKVDGQYLASGTYIDGVGVKPEEVRWHTLLQGVEAVRKDGYDLVAWSAPTAVSGTQTVGYRSLQSPASYQARGQYRGFIYMVRGYKSGSDHPSGALAVGVAIERIGGALAKYNP